MRIQPVLRIAWAVALASIQACQAPPTRPTVPGGPVSGGPAPGASTPGKFGVTLRPALFTLYSVDGRFEGMNLAPPFEPLANTDSGDIVGRYGFALQFDYRVNHWLEFSLGADARSYDVEGLDPIPELDITVDSVDSTQFYVSVRNPLRPLGAEGRWQPFVEFMLSYLPGVDIGFEVDLAPFGSPSNLVIETKSDGYFIGGVTVGFLYRWRPRWLLQVGTTYEIPLTKMDADLSFDVVGQTVPLTAELEPSGLVGFVGISYLF
ncbi:MAG: hypothetical protein CMJ89_17605 [Planctomycetes bacterium]|jgi:hypothetical protein|nr:hypothetical protein [Planctomycetota bacterium]